MPDTAKDSIERRLNENEALRAVSTLKAHYFRLMDQKQWAEWADLFAEDAVMDMRGEAESMAKLGMDVGDSAGWLLRSRAHIRGAVEAALTGVVSVHHGHMPEFTIVSPDEIRAIWAMEDIIKYPAGAPISGFHGYGHYHDTYTRSAGVWRIQETALQRLQVTPS